MPSIPRGSSTPARRSPPRAPIAATAWETSSTIPRSLLSPPPPAPPSTASSASAPTRTFASHCSTPSFPAAQGDAPSSLLAVAHAPRLTPHARVLFRPPHRRPLPSRLHRADPSPRRLARRGHRRREARRVRGAPLLHE